MAVLSQGQTTTVVKVSADRNKILIGEPIQITLEADIPENEAIRFFPVDSLPHFEFLSKEKIDTTNTGSGTVLRQVIQITSFDSGHWVIPPFILAGSIATDSIPVDVVFSEFDPKQAYHDVKDIIEVSPVEEKKTNWWYYAAGGLVLLLVLIYLLTRKKKPVVKAAAVDIDAYTDAMDKLQKIKQERTDLKLYYSGLVDIFRVYVNKRKGLHSLQETTNDLVMQLRNLQLPAEQFEELSNALRVSDFVKFAKYIPEEKDNLLVWETVKRSIETIEKMNTAPVVTKYCAGSKISLLCFTNGSEIFTLLIPKTSCCLG